MLGLTLDTLSFKPGCFWCLLMSQVLKSIDHECSLAHFSDWERDGGADIHGGSARFAPQVAVPCTVDNDLMMVDTSFGFDTACTEAKFDEKMLLFAAQKMR